MFMAQLGAAHTTAISGSLACHGSLARDPQPWLSWANPSLKQVQAAMQPRLMLSGPEVE